MGEKIRWFVVYCLPSSPFILICLSGYHSFMAPTTTTKTRTKTKILSGYKTKTELSRSPKEKKKPMVLAPPPESDGESEIEEVQPKKSQLKSSKQPPKLISANSNAKSSKPVISNVKSTDLKRKAKSLSDSDENVESGEEDEEVVEPGSDEEVEDVYLHGFSTDEDNSSDEEVDDKPGLSAFEVSKLPTVAKDNETIKRKLEKAKRQPVRQVSTQGSCT